MNDTNDAINTSNLFNVITIAVTTKDNTGTRDDGTERLLWTLFCWAVCAACLCVWGAKNTKHGEALAGDLKTPASEFKQNKQNRTMMIVFLCVFS